MSKTDDDRIVALLSKRPKSDARVIAAAVKARKIGAQQAQAYRARLADPKQRTATLRLLTASVEGGGLAPGIMPAAEPEPDYPAEWVPELQAKEARRERRASAPAGGSRVQIEEPDTIGRQREPGRRRVTLEG